MAVDIVPVITQIDQKNNSDSGFTTYKIGPELCYVGSTRNSNSSNLEEELFIGTDKHSSFEEVLQNSGSEPYVTYPCVERTEVTDFYKDKNQGYYTLTKKIWRQPKEKIVEGSKKLILILNPAIYKEQETLQFHSFATGTEVINTISAKRIIYQYEDDYSGLVKGSLNGTVSGTGIDNDPNIPTTG